jgi:MFS family permease
MSLPDLKATPIWRRAGVIVAAGCIISAFSFGIRSTFGLFTLPIIETYGWDRGTFALAFALQALIWGAVQPIAGGFADKFGTARVLIAGSVIYGAGVAAMSISDTPALFLLSAGVVVGIGIATGSFAIVMAAFSRSFGPERRSWAFGIATAASSMGQFLFAPLGQAFINAYGWQMASILLGASMLICIPLALVLGEGIAQGDSPKAKAEAATETTLPLFAALGRAVSYKSYVLLTTGYFVCGFQLAFLTTHLPPYLVEAGIDATTASTALAMIGLFNVIGSYIAGILANRYHKPYLLAVIYAARGVAAIAFLMAPVTALSSIIFAIAMGLLWLSTVPPTAALVSTMFGTRYMGMLYGVVFFSHQVGSFFGVWLGGVFYDWFGSYDAIWWTSVALCFMAALINLPVREAAAPNFGRAPASA